MKRRRTIACMALAAIASHADGLAQGGAIGGAVTIAGAPAADVVVYLVPSEASAPVVIAPITVEMDQRELHFVPRVIVASPGSTIAFTNSDRVMHNVFHPPKGGSAFDLGLFGPGERRGFVFDHEGAFVVFCHVHPEMVGYIVVLATPWRTTTDESGRFSLENLPAGLYVLRTWSSKLQEYVQQVTVVADQKAHLEIPLSRGVPTEPHAKPVLSRAPH